MRQDGASWPEQAAAQWSCCLLSCMSRQMRLVSALSLSPIVQFRPINHDAHSSGRGAPPDSRAQDGRGAWGGSRLPFAGCKLDHDQLRDRLCIWIQIQIRMRTWIQIRIRIQIQMRWLTRAVRTVSSHSMQLCARRRRLAQRSFARARTKHRQAHTLRTKAASRLDGNQHELCARTRSLSRKPASASSYRLPSGGATGATCYAQVSRCALLANCLLFWPARWNR